VQHYNFSISGDSLLSFLSKEYGTSNTNFEKPYITSISPDKNSSGYTYVQLCIPKTSEYIHLWIRTNEEPLHATEIIFYGISHSPDFRDSKIINRGNDYIMKELTTKKFEKLIIERLTESRANA